MIIQTFDPRDSRLLVNELAADEPTVRWLADNDRTLVATNGFWWPATWRAELREALATDRPVTAVEARVGTAEPIPASRGWARLARNLVTAAGWQHQDWAGVPWLAVRTSPRSMLLVAGTGQRPDTLDGGRRLPPTVEPHAEPGRAPKTVVPVTILDARHDFAGTSVARLAVLVDRIPDLPELRFTAHPVPPDARTGLPQTLYVAVHPRGYVEFLLDDGTGRGCYGEPFDLNLVDGTTRTVVGPMSGAPDVLAAYAPDTNMYLGDVAFHTDADRFYQRPGGGVAGGTLTRAAAQRALRLAAAVGTTSSHPAALAKAFEPPTQPPATAPPAQTVKPARRPPQNPTARSAPRRLP